YKQVAGIPVKTLTNIHKPFVSYIYADEPFCHANIAAASITAIFVIDQKPILFI
ncbi:hypothetical protein HPP92_007359, partial [Vanilla planifolia]